MTADDDKEADKEFGRARDVAIHTAREKGVPEILIADQLFYIAMKLAVECQSGGMPMWFPKGLGLPALIQMQEFRAGTIRYDDDVLPPIVYDGLSVLSPLGQVLAVETSKRECREELLAALDAGREKASPTYWAMWLCVTAAGLVRQSARQGGNAKDWEDHYEHMLGRIIRGELYTDEDLLREIADRNLNVATSRPPLPD